MTAQQIKELILKELPTLIQQDSGLREWVLNLGRTQFADQATTNHRFDQMMQVIQQQLADNQQFRDEQNRQWDENQRQSRELERIIQQQLADNQQFREEQNRKWDEQNRKWDENQRQLRELERKSDERWEANQQVINQMLNSIHQLNKKNDQTLGALGTRLGLHSEETFRNAISGILQEFPSGVEVIHVNEFDETGEVFGRPDPIELDLIIRNGQLLIAEIKSSMSRGEMYLFERKARFYENRHQRTVNRLIVISPMVDNKAQQVAAQLGITVYSYTDEVKWTE